MATFFNAAEVYEMGEEIERNGEHFYRKAVELTENAELKDMLMCLADQERDHIALFRELREKLPPAASSTSPLDDDDVSLYLQSLADSKVFKTSEDVDRVLGQAKTIEEILDLALRFEKDSILFFQWARDLTREDWGKEKIDELIEEEKKHIAQLGTCAVKAREGHYA